MWVAWSLYERIGFRVSLRTSTVILFFFFFQIYNTNTNRYKFGRSGSCDVRFKDPRISGTHCRIYRKLRGDTQDFDVFIVDSSANGTYVNGMRLKKNKPVKLESSDKVSLAIRKSKGKQPQIAVYMFQECDIGSKNHTDESTQLRKVLARVLADRLSRVSSVRLENDFSENY